MCKGGGHILKQFSGKIRQIIGWDPNSLQGIDEFDHRIQSPRNLLPLP